MSFTTSKYQEEEEKYSNSYVQQQPSVVIPDHSKNSEILFSQQMQKSMENKIKQEETSNSTCNITFTLLLMLATLTLYLFIYFGKHPLVKVNFIPLSARARNMFGSGAQSEQTQIETFWFHDHIEIMGDFSTSSLSAVLAEVTNGLQQMNIPQHGNAGHVINKRRSAGQPFAGAGVGRTLGTGDRVSNTHGSTPQRRQTRKDEQLPLYQFAFNCGTIIPMILIVIAVILTMCRYCCGKSTSYKFGKVALLLVSFALFGAIMVLISIFSGFEPNQSVQFDDGTGIVRNFQIALGGWCQMFAGVLMIILEIYSICF
eukprot:32687_1